MAEKHYDFYHRTSGKLVRVTLNYGKAECNDEGLAPMFNVGWWSIAGIYKKMRSLGFAEIGKDERD